MIDTIKEQAEEVKNNLEEKREWWGEKPENWQEGELGQEWEEYFEVLKEMLSVINNIETPE